VRAAAAESAPSAPAGGGAQDPPPPPALRLKRPAADSAGLAWRGEKWGALRSM